MEQKVAPPLLFRSFPQFHEKSPQKLLTYASAFAILII
nr:MAG TPA: hypothetical protein [Caudoviricetes sp.]